MVTIEVEGTVHLLEEVSQGYYESREFNGQVGETYVLNILYEDEIYTASSTMRPGFELDSIGIKRFTMGWPADVPHYEILIYGQDPPEPDDYFLFKHSITRMINGLEYIEDIAPPECPTPI